MRRSVSCSPDSRVGARFFSTYTMSTIWQEIENYLKAGNYHNAENKCTEFIDSVANIKCPDQTNSSEELAKAFNNRGFARYKQVRFDDAIEDYDRAIFYDRCYAVAYYNRATIFYRMGDFKLAADGFREALQHNPAFNDADEALVKTEVQIRKSKLPEK